jgi:hypothetical protein
MGLHPGQARWCHSRYFVYTLGMARVKEMTPIKKTGYPLLKWEQRSGTGKAVSV